MRFETEQTIDGSDPPLVLNALERSVAGISINAVRADGELRVYGIGPSPRPVNPRNLTTFRLRPAGQGQTEVRVESEFIASSLLDSSAQEPAVREKISRVLDLAQHEIALHRRSVVEARPQVVEARPQAEQPAPHPVQETARPQPALAESAAPYVQPVRAQPREPRPTPQESRSPETLGWRLPLIAAALLLLITAYLLGRWQGPLRRAAHRAQVPQSSTATLTPQQAAPSDEPRPEPPAVEESAKPSAASRVEPRAQRPASQPRPAQTFPPAPTQNAPNQATPDASLAPDLRDRLNQWAAAMQSNDATTQASFYANHLDRYFLKTDVDHAFVLRDKQDALRRGHRVDQFEVENVQIGEHTATSAKLRLVKHYVVESGPAASPAERFVRSELNLRQIDGRWQITGERDFR